MYFIGFTLSIITVLLPDTYGRAKTYRWFIIPNNILSNLISTSSNYYLKCIGFFLNGFNHSKLSLAIVNISE